MDLDKDKVNVILTGAVIGGILGIGAAYLLQSSGKSSVFTSFGRIIGHLGDAVEKGTEKGEHFVHDVEKKIKKEEPMLANMIVIAAAGVELWKTLKKGV